MNDSGKRQEFATGAVRDTADDKPRPELISPIALRRLAQWLGDGAKKYKARNWEKGIPLSRTLASLLRHLNAWQLGETDEDHLAAVFCNAMFLIHTDDMVTRGMLPCKLNDMPDYCGVLVDEGGGQ